MDDEPPPPQADILPGASSVDRAQRFSRSIEDEIEEALNSPADRAWTDEVEVSHNVAFAH